MKKTKKSNDFSRLSKIKEKPFNIKSIMKFNIFNTIIVVLLIYFVFAGLQVLEPTIVERSPAGNPILNSIFRFILIAALVLTLLGWLVLAYYKKLNNERPN